MENCFNFSLRVCNSARAASHFTGVSVDFFSLISISAQMVKFSILKIRILG